MVISLLRSRCLGSSHNVLPPPPTAASTNQSDSYNYEYYCSHTKTTHPITARVLSVTCDKRKLLLLKKLSFQWLQVKFPAFNKHQKMAIEKYCFPTERCVCQSANGVSKIPDLSGSPSCEQSHHN